MIRVLAILSGKTLLLTLFMLGIILPASSVLAESNFFKNKTITYIVSTKAGGGYDTYARLIARHLPKHLPVNKVVVHNIPGAGHLIGTNKLFHAKPDGLTIGTFNTGLIYAQLLNKPGVEFDLTKLSWIGKASSDPRIMVMGKHSGFKSISDLIKSKTPILFATSGKTSASSIEMELISKALQLNTKMIPGFGGKGAELAVLRGDVSGVLGSYSSLSPFVLQGEGQAVLHIGDKVQLEPSPPSLESLVTSEEGKSIADLLSANTILGRLTAAPPGVPENRLSKLRNAYLKTLQDPELLQEAGRLGIPIQPMHGESLTGLVQRALTQPLDTRKLLGRLYQ
jgi:tripartite-type tricarboxylate transporter receptor subunit TctC